MTAFGSTRPRTRVRSLRLPGLGVVSAAGLVTAAALLPVVQNSTATTAGFETRRLEQRKADLQAAIYQAQTEVAQLGSLDRIDREARGRLGMVPAERAVVIQVKEPAPTGGHVPARFLQGAAPEPEPAAPAPSGVWALLAKFAIN